MLTWIEQAPAIFVTCLVSYVTGAPIIVGRDRETGEVVAFGIAAAVRDE